MVFVTIAGLACGARLLAPSMDPRQGLIAGEMIFTVFVGLALVISTVALWCGAAWARVMARLSYVALSGYSALVQWILYRLGDRVDLSGTMVTWVVWPFTTAIVISLWGGVFLKGCGGKAGE